MKLETALTERSTGSRDRDVIRVDFSCNPVDITTALRRAFAEAATDRSDQDFEDLLRALN